MKLTDLEVKVWNQGERLIPGRTHNDDEIRRHKSSYEFFRQAILRDIEHGDAKSPYILELGFGAGFGAAMLADIPESSIYAIDISEECLEYATINYNRPNIDYAIFDIFTFLHKSNISFDYVVSRNVLEHIENGLDIIIQAKWTKRIIFDVPYAEPAGNNNHHALTNITEMHFQQWPGVEIFYQDLAGTIYDRQQKPQKPNIIIGALSHGNLNPLNTIMNFPIPPVRL